MRLESLPGLTALNPDRVRQFMRSRGWTLQPDRSHPPAFHRYRREGDLALVPGETVADFDRRMAELVEQLAAAHGLPLWQLIDDLSSPLGDVLEIRIEADSVRDGTLPLNAAAGYRQAARDLLLAGAHAALEPRAHFPRMTRKEPLDLLARCREGQSARGSYRIRTIVPLDPQVGLMDLEPLARRAVMTVRSAAAAAVSAVAQDRPEDLLALHPQGVSANLLAALAALEPPGDTGSVALGVRWSHDRPAPEGAHRPVRIGRDAFGHFRAAAQSIRAQTPEPGVELDGYVIQLHSTDATQGGVVSVIGALSDGDTKKVTVALSPQAYGQLVDAHKQGHRVRLVGRLLQKPRSAELQDASILEVVAEEVEGDVSGLV